MPHARQGWRVGDSRVIAAGGREGASEGGWCGGGGGRESVVVAHKHWASPCASASDGE